MLQEENAHHQLGKKHGKSIERVNMFLFPPIVAMMFCFHSDKMFSFNRCAIKRCVTPDFSAMQSETPENCYSKAIYICNLRDDNTGGTMKNVYGLHNFG